MKKKEERNQIKNIQAKQNKVIAYKFKGRRFDCGSVTGFLEANNYFAKDLQ